MNKYLLTLTCLATFGLNAAHFSHKISINPKTTETGSTVYLAKIQIDKKTDENSEAVTIATPELICIEGQAVESIIGTETDFCGVKILVGQVEGQLKAKTAIVVKEGNVDVFVSDEETVIGS